jgi:hypothetical protein
MRVQRIALRAASLRIRRSISGSCLQLKSEADVGRTHYHPPMWNAPALLIALACILLTPGCLCGSSCFDFLSNVAVEALVLGVDEPVEGIDLGAAAGVTVFLAEAESLSSFEANLLDDADRVWVQTETMAAVDLIALGDGLYEATSDESEGLTYSVGATYSIRVSDGGETFLVSGEAPPPPVLTGVPAPGTHAAGSALSFDLSDQNFDNYLAVVADEDGNLVYDNRPETSGDYIDWIRGTDVGVVTIPGQAFPSPGTAYVLGLAGVRKGDDFDGFNPLVSNLALGSLAVEAIVTAP